MPEQKLICIASSRGIICAHDRAAHHNGWCGHCLISSVAGEQRLGRTTMSVPERHHHDVILGTECSACRGEGYIDDVRCLVCRGQVYMPLTLSAVAA